jgi:hypothetical protein
VLQIALVTDQHDLDVAVRVISELLEPSGDVFVGKSLGDVVDEESADCSTVVAEQAHRQIDSAWVGTLQ